MDHDHVGHFQLTIHFTDRSVFGTWCHAENAAQAEVWAKEFYTNEERTVAAVKAVAYAVHDATGARV